MGASSNGETYRIGNAAPQFELARLFYRQFFALNNKFEIQVDDINKLKSKMPTKYFAFTIGKICVSDYFDQNKFNHDPRTQFISWGLMNNGAWDFPANTRGYTPSFVAELVTPKHELRGGFSLIPTTPNGMNMNWDIYKAGSFNFEYTKNYKLANKNGALRLISFLNYGNMGNYNESISLFNSSDAFTSTSPNIKETEQYGRIKYGLGINTEQELTENIGAFLRASWNDGQNETWAYTEIDHTMSVGISINGRKWKRPKDNIGVAYVISGLSAPHRNYLTDGGKGFELGDGALNYRPEQLGELYYSFELTKSISVSGIYQFIANPGFNKDRGPVNVLSLRIHCAI